MDRETLMTPTEPQGRSPEQQSVSLEADLRDVCIAIDMAIRVLVDCYKHPDSGVALRGLERSRIVLSQRVEGMT